MSHNYHFRRTALDSNLRPDPGPHSSSDRHHASAAHDFYRLPQDSSSSSSYPSSSPSSYNQSSSSSSSRGTQWSQDSALSILSSCGLEPSDLALLAKLPEDVLTVESLPQVLKQIKQKRGIIKPFTPNPLSAPSSAAASSSSYPHSSTHQPAANTVPTSGDESYRQLIQYPLDHLTASPLPPSGQECWGSPTTSLSARAKPPRPSSAAAAAAAASAAASSYMVDFHHRPQPSDYKVHQYTSSVPSQGFQQRPGPSGFDKMGRTTGPIFSQDYHNRPGLPQFGKTGRDIPSVSPHNQASFHSAGSGQQSRFGHPAAPSPDQSHPKTYAGRSVPQPKSSSQPAAPMPTKKEALDFHGTSPKVFPYSCSLCDITVMSEKVWAKHINGTNHADGQLSLLQRFPQWDCRMETITKYSSPSEKGKNEGVPDSPSQVATQNSAPQAKPKVDKKIPDKGKVVCVKFPAQALDEAQLRKMVEPFGEVVKIVLFPSLAFVELGSISQANDLVKFHSICPPTVNGNQVQFEIAATFSFMQSSQVVSFTPAPTGQSGRSDLISIIKRFGWPLYTLFLPSVVFVEMKNASDAKKLVEYYLSNTLKINSDILKVSYSGEYKSLMHVPLAKKFEEEVTQEVRSTSREKEEKRKRSRTRSRSREKSRKGKGTRSRSRSKERSSIRRRTRSRSRSKEKSRKEKRTRSRSRSRSKSRGRSNRDKRSRSKSRSTEKSSKGKRNRSRSRSRSKSTEKTSKGKRNRSRSRSRSKSRGKSSRDKRSRSKSRSTEKSSKGKRNRSRSRSRSKSTERSNRGKRNRSRSKSTEKSNRGKRTSSRSRSKEKSSREKRNRSRSRSKSRGKSSRDERSRSKSRSREKSTVAEKTEATDTEPKTEPDPAAVMDIKPKAEAEEQAKEEAESSEEESDIEGMEVIGEDVEDLEDEDDTAAEEENEEEEEQVEEAAERDCLTTRADSAKPDEEEKVEEAGPDDPEQQAEQQEPDLPADLENCITLDEVKEEQSEDRDKSIQDETKSPSGRVLRFSNLPRRILNDKEFLNLLGGFGTPVHGYHEAPNSGFVEMSTSSEAVKAVEELNSKPVTVRNTKLVVQMSDQYATLTNGWPLKLDEKKSRCRTRSSARRQNRDESDGQSEGATESSDNTSTAKEDPEQPPATEEVPDQESTSMKAPEEESACVQDLELESTSMKGLDQESASMTDVEQQPTTEEPPDKESASMKDPNQESASKEDPDEKPTTTEDPDEKPTTTEDPDEKPTTTEDPDEKPTTTEDPDQSAATKDPEKERDNNDSQDQSAAKKKPPASRRSSRKPSKKKLGAKMNESVSETPQDGAANGRSEDACRATAEKESASAEEKVPAEAVCAADETSEKILVPETDQDEAPDRKETCENDSASEETGMKSADAPEDKMLENPEKEDSKEEPELKESESPHPTDSTQDLSKLQSGEEQVQEPAGAPENVAELQQSTKPVGAEFVRPVVGYLCHLCQLIYTDEDEAKGKHCSSLTHYRKYQEKTGKDPWAS